MFVQARIALAASAAAALVGAGAAAPAAPHSAVYRIQLTGQADVDDRHPGGGAGDMDGSGTLTLAIDPATRQICYRFRTANVSTDLMAHIHRGAAGSNGPTVVTLFTGPGGKQQDCLVWTSKLLNEIVANASNFYVSFYTLEYPDGALRGQL